MLNEGESIKGLLGSDCKKPIFLVTPLFLHFCLWFLCNGQKYCTFNNSNGVYESLIQYCRRQFNLLDEVLEEPVLHSIVKSYPAIDIISAVRKTDTLGFKFLKDVLQNLKVLIVKSIETVELFLPVINPEMVNISASELSVSHIKDGDITVNIGEHEVVRAQLFPKLCQLLAQCGKIHLQSNLYLDIYQYETITSLNIVSHAGTAIRDFKHTKQVSPNLTHLSFVDRIINQPVLEALSTAVSKTLTHLSFVHCDDMNGKLLLLFKSVWPKLSHLNLSGTKVFFH